MIDDLVRLLHREAAACNQLEGRLRTMELLVAAGEQRFVPLALEEFERASEELASLELTRSLAICGAGLDPDLTARELRRHTGDDARLGDALRELATASEAVADARARTHDRVAGRMQDVRARAEASAAFRDG